MMVERAARTWVSADWRAGVGLEEACDWGTTEGKGRRRARRWDNGVVLKRDGGAKGATFEVDEYVAQGLRGAKGRIVCIVVGRWE